MAIRPKAHGPAHEHVIRPDTSPAQHEAKRHGLARYRRRAVLGLGPRHVGWPGTARLKSRPDFLLNPCIYTYFFFQTLTLTFTHPLSSLPRRLVSSLPPAPPLSASLPPHAQRPAHPSLLLAPRRPARPLSSYSRASTGAAPLIFLTPLLLPATAAARFSISYSAGAAARHGAAARAGIGGVARSCGQGMVARHRPPAPVARQGAALSGLSG